uniref:RNA helicase n=1 Tax=Panagrolaimus sp. JU765 TaxID=591449 RepID=A0AC34QUR2_9BILA
MSDSSDNEYDGPIEKLEEKPEDEKKTFAELGVNEVLCAACEKLGWKKPSKIQIGTIPAALDGKDVIGLAETGSGKTAAFAIPILQELMEQPQKLFALVLTPTRELAFQIAEQFQALGSTIGLLVAVIVGGVDKAAQTLALARRPHIIIATPGRLVDHLEETKGFNLRSLKFLVLDEADRMLNLDFEIELDKILKVIPKDRRTFLFSATMTTKVNKLERASLKNPFRVEDRRTFLFSATMTTKVNKLERASLKNPFRVEVSNKYQTVETLKQYLLFIPQKYKDANLVYLLNEKAGNTFIIFCGTCNVVLAVTLMLRHLGFPALPLHGQMNQEKRISSLAKFKAKERTILVFLAVTLMLRHLGFPALPLHGQMNQEKRISSLAKFKAKERTILVCTDVASRGLDIPHVDVVINYDVPGASKDYVHRVGRTARAGRSGVAVTMVTQYDVELFQKIESLIGLRLDKYPTNNEEVLLLVENVDQAAKMARGEVRDLDKAKRDGKKKSSAFIADDEIGEGKKSQKRRGQKGGNNDNGKMKIKRLR